MGHAGDGGAGWGRQQAHLLIALAVVLIPVPATLVAPIPAAILDQVIPRHHPSAEPAFHNSMFLAGCKGGILEFVKQQPAQLVEVK